MFIAQVVLSGKVGIGKCDPERGLFRPPKFTNDTFMKIGFDMGCILVKCIIFLEFTYLGCQNVLLNPNLYGNKSTDWFKDGPFEKQMV